MKPRKDRLALEKIYIRKQLRSALFQQERAIKHGLHYGQAVIKNHLKSIEYLFVPEAKKKSICNIAFNISIPRSKYKELKHASEWIRYSGIKELRRAVKNLDAIKGRQFFRNSEIFRLMLIEIKKYIKNIKGDKYSKKLSKIKGDVGQISKRYIQKRLLATKKLKSDIETANKKMKKSIFINDIEDYINLFMDFFTQEEERLYTWKMQILHCINVSDDDVVTDSIAKDIPLRLDLPSWKVFISNIE